MTAISKRNALVALLMTLCLLLALAVPAFADGEEATAAETVAETVVESAEAATDAGTEAVTAAGTEAATEAKTEAETEPAPVDRTKGIINLAVGAVILIAIVVLIIVFRAKIPVWFKAVKSECGKIVWCPKDKLKKNSFVVIVIIVILAVLIGLLDYAFSEGIILLGKVI